LFHGFLEDYSKHLSAFSRLGGIMLKMSLTNAVNIVEASGPVFSYCVDEATSE
jgi:hypothetical protein